MYFASSSALLRISSLHFAVLPVVHNSSEMTWSKRDSGTAGLTASVPLGEMGLEKSIPLFDYVPAEDQDRNKGAMRKRLCL